MIVGDVVTSNSPVLLLRISMSVSLARPEKSPKPATCHSNPTWPMAPPSDGVVADVVDLERAGVAVAHHHVGFAGAAGEIAEARHLPLQSDLAHARPSVMLLLLMS